MMMTLFSSFNPTSNNLMINNYSLLMTTMIFMPKWLWMINSKPKKMMTSAMMALTNQLYNMMNKMTKMSTIMNMSLMMMIMMLNMMSLFPFIFSWTAHLSMTLSMSLPLWMMTMLKKSMNMNKLLSEMVPSSTPTILIPLMSLIEMISMIIQPLTLSVRLMANITAGHLLLILTTNMYQLMISTPMASIIHMMMTILEISVAMIQSYVFAMLMTMYMK